jgi:hypothetical protein
MSDELKRLTAVVTAIPGLPVSAVAAAVPTPSTPSAMDWALQLRAVQADVAALRDQFNSITATQQQMMAVLLELRAERTAPVSQ